MSRERNDKLGQTMMTMHFALQKAKLNVRRLTFELETGKNKVSFCVHGLQRDFLPQNDEL
ncbi:CLUMA_CG009705, isoform A [Clunio marinus]|uniref:CLUMA_CG009705, isoform A n=1 Tax=Clunio marinus TaxID=568069 RepID=A0A1J1I7W6_9DIPT|nr:CLUMA_CG009705, isoform A [Clunio marinus]